MNQTINIQIAPGELVDKLTILDIKLARMTDSAQLRNVAAERDLLGGAYADLASANRIARLRMDLREVNEALWIIEDDIRDCERRGDFGSAFVELARAVYKTNDKRAAIKRAINVALGSALLEEKAYTSYA